MRATSTNLAIAAGAVALVLAWPLQPVGAQPPGKATARLVGVATIYSADYRGVTASGQRYDPRKFTAAHRTLPFGTRLKITDPRSGRSVDVVVNDRGPFTRGRILDLSWAAGQSLHAIDRGVFPVVATIE
jgi:rare lipoprotein A